MADPALSANQQQPNGKTSPFSPYRHAGGGDGSGGGPFLVSPPTSQQLLQGEEMDSRWQPREANQPSGSPLSGEDGCPGVECATPRPVGGGGAGQGLGAPEGAVGEVEGQNCGAVADIQKTGDGEQLGLQMDPQCQDYCGPGGQRCRPQPGGEEERQLGKKKHRRRPSKKKRHWKPYYKLTWEEKKKFDEKQSQRASRLRAEMFAKGQPVAPYNTTQFLMEDHDQEEPDLKPDLCPKRSATKSDDTSEEDFMEDEDGGSDGMGGDGSEFLQKDFSETYERYHVESLQNMNKQELIKEYLELEKCLSRMEEENNRLRVENKKFAGDSTEDPRVRQLEQELDSLRAENQKLLKENELYRQQEKPLSKLGE
ncbi:protein HEXIM1 [Hemicordylus capensis]|uniref:protein HEXIM1 n=1 Tax=Hemicordylus capensis TaxID=884348 RepID=UPI0023041501|nr:protein HEXIM1 [Hemicordylus capensis]XP_053121691.1 protein HEXIM1 [Hemicordylus capensis]XP_053121693.1 protein HEXIM1 [Hemicordylus capensis]XP_053121694.1 protein HEXIM1 [Hemicordylus capensis]XP_053121695.1 protein HEXIM1 [Hemicordylus capensis]